MTDWIEWEGAYGCCPEPPEAEVEVRFRNDRTAMGLCSEFGWRHSKSVIQAHADSDIVAYRVVPAEPEPEAPEAKTGVWISTKTTVISTPAHPDAVNQPSHYTDGGIEAIDYIRAKLGPDGFRSYCLGNVLKYVSRAGKKGDAGEDLRKAKVYLEWAIND